MRFAFPPYPSAGEPVGRESGRRAAAHPATDPFGQALAAAGALATGLPVACRAALSACAR
jgi:hypothetical protein